MIPHIAIASRSFISRRLSLLNCCTAPLHFQKFFAEFTALFCPKIKVIFIVQEHRVTKFGALLLRLRLLPKPHTCRLAKQGQVPVVLLLEYFLLKRNVSTQRLVLLFFLICSVIYATIADVHFNFAGSVAAVLNLFLAALEMVCLSMAQQQGEKLGSMAVMHMTLPWAIGLTGCLIPVMEASQVVEVFSQEFTVPLAGMLFVSCLCAFFVNWSTALVTGKASALTYVLLGQFKTIMILVMGIIFFDGMPTFKTICGGGVALCFLTAYSIVTMQEQAAQQAAATPKEEPQGGSKKEDAV
ncbi:hypothetical protein CYMTET_8453 [Cymbomonas tetramitiformis]|uniref:Sugar phosphate transporter domain-containing protein n=1 Tax=Cymbomonas tetramitiformis TaxID=36881 RepID=A0AAE0GT90_9CHLO|nr:hypothetical protein CYMTET_8453 [Cymbomonas tetramitiformis]